MNVFVRLRDTLVTKTISAHIVTREALASRHATRLLGSQPTHVIGRARLQPRLRWRGRRFGRQLSPSWLDARHQRLQCDSAFGTLTAGVDMCTQTL